MSRMSLAIPLGTVLAAMLTACGSGEPSKMPMTVEVGYVTVQSQVVPLNVELPGRVNASSSAEVRPQVAGIIKRRLFKEGSVVKAGEVLYEIDPATYQAAYDEAKASLKNAEATLNSSRLKSERYAELVAIEGVSKQDADDAKATYLQALANIDQMKAALETARINLDYTRIKAPISGRIGISTVTPGALVTASQTTALATIRALDPIYVDLTQSSVEQLQLKSLLEQSRIQSGSGKVRLVLEDGSVYEHPANLQFGEIAVDENTGSVTLRAEVPNPKGKLLPGMFVRAQLDQAVDREGILVPQQGIAQDPKGGATAMVIGTDNKVVSRPVVLQRAYRDAWLVASGLKVGDRLVVEGLSKVKNGQQVSPVEAQVKPAEAATDAKEAAKPAENTAGKAK